MKTPYELFGVEHNKGWRHIVEPLIKRCNEEGVTILQIKEKFGTLRFYVQGASDELYEAIEAAERESEVTCEKCGTEGKLRTDGWWRILCDECEKELGHDISSKETYSV